MSTEPWLGQELPESVCHVLHVDNHYRHNVPSCPFQPGFSSPSAPTAPRDPTQNPASLSRLNWETTGTRSWGRCWRRQVEWEWNDGAQRPFLQPQSLSPRRPSLQPQITSSLPPSRPGDPIQIVCLGSPNYRFPGLRKWNPPKLLRGYN